MQATFNSINDSLTSYGIAVVQDLYMGTLNIHSPKNLIHRKLDPRSLLNDGYVAFYDFFLLHWPAGYYFPRPICLLCMKQLLLWQNQLKFAVSTNMCLKYHIWSKARPPAPPSVRYVDPTELDYYALKNRFWPFCTSAFRFGCPDVPGNSTAVPTRLWFVFILCCSSRLLCIPFHV